MKFAFDPEPETKVRISLTEEEALLVAGFIQAGISYFDGENCAGPRFEKDRERMDLLAMTLQNELVGGKVFNDLTKEILLKEMEVKGRMN